jgi:MFS family permease
MTRSIVGRPAGLRESRTPLYSLHRWSDSALPSDFWSIAATTFLFNLGISIFLFLFNLLMLDLGFRERALGIFTSAMSIGAVTGAFPMGMLAVRFGYKRALTACLLLLATAFAARVFLIWTPAQIILSLLDGVGLCGWTVCLSPWVASVVEERRRPLAFSLLFATAVVGGSLGGFVGGHMPEWCRWVAEHMGSAISPIQGERITLVGASATIWLAALPLARLANDSAPQARLRLPMPSPFLVRFLVATACWGAAMGAVNPFVNVIFSHYLRVATPRLGSLFSLTQLAGAAAVLLVPMLLRRTGLVSGILVIQLASAAFLGWISRGHGLLQIELAYCGFMAAQLMCDPATQTLLMNRVTPQERSNAAAMSFLVLSVAQAVAAAAAGLAFTRFYYAHVIAGIAFVAAAAAVAFRLLCGGTDDPQPVCLSVAVPSETLPLV